MLDLNITLLFQLVNFLVAVYVLNLLLVKPIREIIKKRKGVLDELGNGAAAFESQAAEKLDKYEASLAKARLEATAAREQGRNNGLSEKDAIVGAAQKSAKDILDEARRSVQAQAESAIAELRAKVKVFSQGLADRLVQG